MDHLANVGSVNPRVAGGVSCAPVLEIARVRAEPFNAIELDLAVLWADIAKTGE